MTCINIEITEYLKAGKLDKYQVYCEVDIEAKWGFCRFFEKKEEIARAVLEEIKKRRIDCPVYNVSYNKKRI